jgi:hypothetical protein
MIVLLLSTKIIDFVLFMIVCLSTAVLCDDNLTDESLSELVVEGNFWELIFALLNHMQPT